MDVCDRIKETILQVGDWFFFIHACVCWLGLWLIDLFVWPKQTSQLLTKKPNEEWDMKSNSPSHFSLVALPLLFLSLHPHPLVPLLILSPSLSFSSFTHKLNQPVKGTVAIGYYFLLSVSVLPLTVITLKPNHLLTSILGLSLLFVLFFILFLFSSSSSTSLCDAVCLFQREKSYLTRAQVKK